MGMSLLGKIDLAGDIAIAPRGGAVYGALIQEIDGLTFSSPTQVGNVVFAFFLGTPANANPALDQGPWAILNTTTAGGIKLWVLVRQAFTSVTRIDDTSGVSWAFRHVAEVQGLDHSLLTSPASNTAIGGAGVVPAFTIPRPAQSSAFCLLLMTSSFGYGGSPNLISWWAGGWFGAAMEVQAQPHIFTAARSQTGGGVGSGEMILWFGVFNTT